MFSEENRRNFLSRVLGTAGAALLGGPAVLTLAETGRPKAPLSPPRFYWGVGIENCWIAQTNPAKDGNRRLLDVYLQMDHYRRWKSDLDLAREAGFNAIRYSVPWYKAEPRPGEYDWSWIDKPIDYLVSKLKIIPIMDLIHYGTPAWMEDGVIDERFPEAIGRYAAAMATHFKGLVNYYSPHNEPGLTCLFCGLVGRWPPYHKSVESWAKIGVAVAKGMVLEMEAIRRAISDSVVVSVDPYFYQAVDGFLPKPGADPAQHDELRRAAAVYPASLAYGKVQEGHPLAGFLKRYGVSEEDLAWFRTHAQRPDILGYNFYPDIHVYSKYGDYTRKGEVPLEQAAQEATGYLARGLREAQRYFDLPVYLTETSAGLTTEAKIAYINALNKMVVDFRREKFPLVGLNWWPLFETIQWDYREKSDKPLRDFIYAGGWNNGLWVIDPKSDGRLDRVPTPAVAAYQSIIRRDGGALAARAHPHSANRMRCPTLI